MFWLWFPSSKKCKRFIRKGKSFRLSHFKNNNYTTTGKKTEQNRDDSYNLRDIFSPHNRERERATSLYTVWKVGTFFFQFQEILYFLLYCVLYNYYLWHHFVSSSNCSEENSHEWKYTYFYFYIACPVRKEGCTL